MNLRPAVKKFAELMESRLRENDHKGDWSGDAPEVLLQRLRANVATLPGVESAIDTANYCLMLADKEGVL